jgi:hypothetical protein
MVVASIGLRNRPITAATVEDDARDTPEYLRGKCSSRKVWLQQFRMTIEMFKHR